MDAVWMLDEMYIHSVKLLQPVINLIARYDISVIFIVLNIYSRD